MRDAWEKLIERYAEGKPICNCKQAYYSLTGTSWLIGKPGERMKELHNQPECKYGCQANQYAVKNYIAECVFKELEAGTVHD